MMNRKYYLHILGTAVVAVLCSIANNFSVGVGAAETLSASDALVSEAKREPIYKKFHLILLFRLCTASGSGLWSTRKVWERKANSRQPIVNLPFL